MRLVVAPALSVELCPASCVWRNRWQMATRVRRHPVFVGATSTGTVSSSGPRAGRPNSGWPIHYRWSHQWRSRIAPLRFAGKVHSLNVGLPLNERREKWLVDYAACVDVHRPSIGARRPLLPCSPGVATSRDIITPNSANLLAMLGIVDTIGPVWTAVFIATSVYLVTGGWHTVRVILAVAPRDIKLAMMFFHLNRYVHKRVQENATVGRLFERTAARVPTKPCFVTQDRTWTFSDVEQWANRVAHYFAGEGFRSGDEVAIFTASRPETVMLWLGLSKIGVVSSLINSSLKRDALVHSITCVNSSAVVFTVDLLEPLLEVTPALKEKIKDVRFYVLGAPNDEAVKGFDARRLESLLEDRSTDPPPPCGGIEDRLMYLYTSGTTGLPKAAIIKHHRYIATACAVRYVLPLRDDDVLYICLPFYHTTGSILGSSQALIFGNTAATREAFSGSAFWDDCIRYRCTVIVYVGEVCRYLLAQPPKPQDRQHKVRVMVGSGLRPRIWKEFVRRFGIKDIREAYGATESNANLMNIDNRVGAVGFIPYILKAVPWLAERVLPVRLIKVDEETGVPLRDEKGMCIPCGPNEVGELVGKVRDAPMHKFDGYVSQEATDKKLYSDVFHKGDVAFASGDLLVMDELGYVYFYDRTGDTFRWKGENVSTAEVEAVISKLLGQTDCIVYGVTIPGAEGKAGMAAILDPDHETDLHRLLRELRKELPAYAVPIFIRLPRSLAVTGTLKMKKTELRKQEFHLDRVDDPIFFLDSEANRYVRLDGELYARISAGELRV